MCCLPFPREDAIVLIGCIEGFFETENGKENGIKSTKFINKLCVLKSVKKVKLFLPCHSLFPEKFNFLYTF